MPKNRLKIASQAGGRVRFIYPALTLDTDYRRLEAQILEIEGVKSVRVNRAAKSVILVLEDNSNLNEIENEILKFELHKSAPHPVNPAKIDIYKSLAALSVGAVSSDSTINRIVTMLSAKNLFKDGVKELWTSGLNSKTLEALAVAVSLARGDYLAANGTNLLINIGEYIEESTVHRSDELIKELARPAVKEAWVEVSINGRKELKLTPTKELKKGDIVVVGTGESIAIDGYVVEGTASVNQVSMTGEAEPVKKERGDRVMSGTIVDEGRIKIWAELIGEQTATARIKEYIQASLNEKSTATLKATRLADKLVPVTLALAGLSWVINRNAQAMASVLQADYSCALKLATPVAFKTAIGKAGHDGILIKGAKTIEALASADTFVFDKTGTLTSGNLAVAEVYSFDKTLSEGRLLDLTASAEEHYFHPVAEAIVRAAKEKGFRHIHHEEVEFVVAHGVKTLIGGKEIVIGSRHFLEDDEKIDFAPHANAIAKAQNSGHALLYVGYAGKLAGIIALKDEIRANAKDCIKKLRAGGVKQIVMITGDTAQKANEVAKALGIDKAYADCLPTGKAEIIEELRAKGHRVAFVGDGINDAPSLVRADVGISMSKGADIAKASADVSLLKDDIMNVANAKIIANKTMKKIGVNFKTAVSVNSAILLGATLGKLNPVATAALHNGTTIALLLNSLKGVTPDIKD